MGFFDLAPKKVVQTCSDSVVSARASKAPCNRIVNAYRESILDVAVLQGFGEKPDMGR